MKPRRIVVAVLVLVAAGLLLAYISYSRNPLTHSQTEVRAWLLQKTPIGSTRDQVMATIEGEHWSGHREYRGEFRPEVEHRQYPGYGAELGSYGPSFLPCHASAYWLFGADDCVTQVFVSKWCEGL